MISMDQLNSSNLEPANMTEQLVSSRVLSHEAQAEDFSSPMISSSQSPERLSGHQMPTATKTTVTTTASSGLLLSCFFTAKSYISLSHLYTYLKSKTLSRPQLTDQARDDQARPRRKDDKFREAGVILREISDQFARSRRTTLGATQHSSSFSLKSMLRCPWCSSQN